MPARWGFDPRDAGLEVWRAELRAGKHELKEHYALWTFQDVLDGIGDVFKRAMADVRYLCDIRTDSNVSRADKHPLWIALQLARENGLNNHESGLAPGRIIEIQREELRQRCLDNVAGNALSLAGGQGMTAEQVFK